MQETVMSRVNAKGSGPGLPKLGPRGLVPKLLVSTAIALGSGMIAEAANADPGPSDTHPNPFSTLGCSCQGTDLTGSHAPSVEVDRGIIAGAHAAITSAAPQPE
jgi:hypothetical protein